MGTILTAPYSGIRAIAGLDVVDLTDASIETDSFLPVVEAMVTAVIARQASCGVPSVANILARTGGATPADLVFLKSIVTNIVAKLYQPSSTNAINTSITTGDQTVDRGGIGLAWVQAAEKYLQEAQYEFSFLTNWCETTPDIFVLGGPTSQGVDANTVSGFFIR